MVDIDRFKTLNDTHGHTFGDNVIRAVSDALVVGIRKDDVACRFGGDEFMLILRDCSLSEALAKAADIKHKIEITVNGTLSEVSTAITVSIGVAAYPDHGADMDTILKAVDFALYQAKYKGRNRVVSAGEIFTTP